jgi:hypothetical protein
MQAPDAETLSRYGWTDKKEVRISGKMLRSKAFIDLSNTSKIVLMLFMQRRTWSMSGKGKNAKRVYQNRGLLFSYREASDLWNINQRTFRDCIEQLIGHGFLRIEKQGGTFQGKRVSTVYMLVDDWMHYGTSLFMAPEVTHLIATSSSLRRFNTERKNNFSTEPRLTERVSSTSVEKAKEGF